MSFGSGFGGFGSNNSTSTPAFGGFGNNNAAQNTGFGATNTGFGATNPNTGGGLFGAGSSNTTVTAFGASGGFGSNSGAFGANKPAFGATATTSGPSLFGSTTATGGGTGFGSNFGSAPNNTATTSFGGSAVFGGSKPSTGFGATSGTTSGGLFGGGASTGTGFGATANTGFGATANPGLNSAVGDAPGTVVVPFTPTVERETASSNASNSFQNILFQDPYKKWSAEELRLADYAQNRRFGNTGGTGAFGVSTGFGSGTSTFGGTAATSGFGSTTGGGLFGNTANNTAQPASTGFGAPATNAGFGASSGSSLFGQNKPAGGLFGATSQPAQSGGLFGGTSTGTTPFGGASNTTSTPFGASNTGGGLFGNNANKPAGTFGATPAATGTFGSSGTTGGFGATTTPSTGGGLFGNPGAQANSTGTSLFGGQQQQNNTGFGGTGAFGSAATPAGGSSLFGNQSKPATGGLFSGGTTNTATTGTGGGLFGNSTGSAFGAQNNNTQPAAGGLFGAPKPAAGGLFGGSATPGLTNAGGGLFGGSIGSNIQAQQPATTSLFGGSANNQPKTSLFGSLPATNTGLFGNQTSQASTGLFGATATQNQQQPNLQGSLFGGSPNGQPAHQSLATSIIDPAAFGSTSLLSNLPDDKLQNPGPLATPLSGQAKLKRRSILPMYKLSPANAARFVTPQKRGFGFSYSTYGSPNTPNSSNSTPGGLSQSLNLISGNNARGFLSKSISSSSLRRSFNVEDSILAPGAFSASTSRLLGSSNPRKLVINRDLRSSDLFSPSRDGQGQDSGLGGPRKLSKRVSFDTPSGPGRETQTPESTLNDAASDDSGLLRPSSEGATHGANGIKPSTANGAPEMEQVKGNELTVVPEEGSPRASRQTQAEPGDSPPGAYWMHPRKEDIEAMNRMQRQQVTDFEVGRENVGSVKFKVPVDLTNIDLNHIFGEIVILEPRSATVYPVLAKKPPVGKGLNVPAMISLEQSWPRGRDRRPARMNKHIERLKAMQDTTFIGYDTNTGVWTFSVEHFTTYGLDDDSDDAEEITKSIGNVKAVVPSKNANSPVSDPDDTYEFKRSRRGVPGAFDEAVMSDDDENEISDADIPVRQHAASLSSRDSAEDDMGQPAEDEVMEDQAANDHEEDQAVVAHLTEEGMMEKADAAEDPSEFSIARNPDVPAGILRARMRAARRSTAPTRIEVAGGNDWTQILQESVRAPRTVDRATLRSLNETGEAWNMRERGSPVPQDRHHEDSEEAGFATSIDLMKSIFEQAKAPPRPAQGPQARGFVKWPYLRRATLDENRLEPPVCRPNWGPDGVLVTSQDNETSISPVDIGEIGATSMILQEVQTFADRLANGEAVNDWTFGSDAKWKLAAILMDPKAGGSVSGFWQDLVSSATARKIKQAQSLEEKAIIALAGNLRSDACAHLLSAKDFHLATLVATIGSHAKDIRDQLDAWREAKVLSEMSEPVRVLYELLAGNGGACAGTKDAPLEDRIESFVISERFGLDWQQAFGLRLFCTASEDVETAVRLYQVDIEQGKEREPEDDPLWALLKIYALREFDWTVVNSVGWLMTKILLAQGNETRVDFGPDAEARWNQTCIDFAASLTALGQWALAVFVLASIEQTKYRDSAVLDHLGRHGHLLGSPQDPNSPFSVFLKVNKVPAAQLWEAKALYLRSQKQSKQEFLALLWARNYQEAHCAFLDRLAPELILKRDYQRLYRFAGLLFKVRHRIPNWNRGALVYLLFPIVRAQSRHEATDTFDSQLFDALLQLRGAAQGDVWQEAAIADMAEDLIKARGDDPRLYQLLPGDMQEKYFRDAALGVA